MKTHVRSSHEEKCGRCDLAFKDKQKLKDHTCKLHIRNPSQGNCYMKNWVLANGCTQVINKATMEEIVKIAGEKYLHVLIKNRLMRMT